MSACIVFGNHDGITCPILTDPLQNRDHCFLTSLRSVYDKNGLHQGVEYKFSTVLLV